MFQTKDVEKFKTHILRSNNFFRAIYDLVWKNMVRPTRPQMTIHYGAEKMRFACRITKAGTRKLKVKVKFTLEQATKV
jgi:hypothetical protein